MSLDFERLAMDVEAKLLALPRAKKRGDEIVHSCLLPDRHTNRDAHPSASYSIAKRAHRCKGCNASGGLLNGDYPITKLLSIDVDAYRAATPAPRAFGRPTRSWEIRDHDGNVVAIHNRADLPDRGKRVWWTMPDGTPKLVGIGTADLPLYGIDRLGTREPGDDAPVILTEGEPAADALHELNLRVVGTVTGAASAPSAKVLAALRGEDVVLWADADDPGAAHMARVAALLEGVAASVRVFAPENLCEGGDAVDWIRARASTPNLATVLLAEIEEQARSPKPIAPTFEPLPNEAGYRLAIPEIAAVLEVTYLRRDRHQLRGEIMARCSLPGAKTFNDGVLSVADTNLSSARSRKEHADHLAAQARSEAEPWRDAVEDLAQRVLAAERTGQPDICLADVTPEPIKVLEIDGLRLPRHHPAILFGDGDSLKSMLVLFALGSLMKQGLRVGFCDWELSASDHRERLGRLFPGELPLIRYMRGERPIVHEADRLRRWVRDQRLDFVAFDSVAYACAGAPESAEVAMGYFQTVRQLGLIGSVHIAHVTKNMENADRRPFGSAFWHNSARGTWFTKLADREPGGTVSRVGLYPRKWNLGPLPASTGFEVVFLSDRTIVRRTEIADTPELAAGLSVKQRMYAVLRAGSMKVSELADEIDAKRDTIEKTARRHASVFNLSGGVISLLERRAS